jgi:hypothetical protein
MRVETPIACTLTDTDARARVRQWQEILDSSVIAARRASPGRLELTVRGVPALIAALAELASVETQCCRFFRFTMDIRDPEVTLAISVPDGAIETLDGFAEMAARASTQQIRHN